jgi:beta-glucoside PTS system EIICBA component
MKKIGNQLIESMGHLDNVESVARCYTRLRVRIKDDSKVTTDKINKIDGVVKAFSSDGKLQIVMPEYLDKVFDYINAQFVGESGVSNANATTEKVNKKREKITFKRLLNGILDAISNSLTPVIGGLAMAGLFLALLNLLTVSHLVTQGKSDLPVTLFDG